MIVRLLILGILTRRGMAHGYRIHRDLVEWRVETWTTIRRGSIYHALAQLEKQGFIKESAHVSGSKSALTKAEYQLTAKGKEEFVRLLKTVLQDINIIELSVGIAFMEHLTRQEVIALLKKRQEAQKQVSDFLQTLPTEDVPASPAKHPELIRIWTDSYIDAAASTQKIIDAIESGKYAFKNEEKK